MCWLCDHPDATSDDYLDRLRGLIAKNGWVVQYIEDDRCPFAYTIGLHAYGLSELVITGVAPERAALLLNGMADYCVTKVQPEPGETMNLPDGWAEFVRFSARTHYPAVRPARRTAGWRRRRPAARCAPPVTAVAARHRPAERPTTTGWRSASCPR